MNLKHALNSDHRIFVLKKNSTMIAQYSTDTDMLLTENHRNRSLLPEHHMHIILFFPYV